MTATKYTRPIPHFFISILDTSHSCWLSLATPKEHLVNSTFRTSTRLIAAILCFSLFALTTADAQPQQLVTATPLPNLLEKITSAKTIFLQNGGTDSGYASDMIGGANGPYNSLTASLQAWGRFQLVTSPTQADLIFNIRGAQDYPDSGQTDKNGNEIYYRRDLFYLTVTDPATNSQLWSVTMPAGWAGTLKGGQTAYARSVVNLTSQIKLLVNTPLTSAEIKSLKPQHDHTLLWVGLGLGVIAVTFFSIRALSANKHCHPGVPCDVLN